MSKRAKKVLIIACFILMVIVLFTVAFQWYFNPARLPEDSELKARAKRMEDLTARASDFTGLFYGSLPETPDKEDVEALLSEVADDNAMKYYLTAALEIQEFPHFGEIWDRAVDVIYEGWQENDPELEEIIKQNEHVFDLIRKGNGSKYCSFPDEEPLRIGEFSYMMLFRDIARLLIVRAKHCERNEAYDEARETYADVLRFAATISDNGRIVHALSGTGIQSFIYYGITGYLQTLEDEVVCERFLADLAEIEEGRGSLHDVLERDFTHMARMLKNIDLDFECRYQLYYGGLNDPLDDLPKDPLESILPAEYVIDAFTRAGGYIIGRVMGPIYMKRSRRKQDKFAHTMLDASKQPYPELFKSGLEERIPNDVLVEISFPAIEKFIVTFGRSEADRRAIIVRTALHLHFLQHREYPETLEELAPLVPQEILIDPFSMERFVYKLTDDGYMFYSLGPNLKDDGGVDAGYPFSEGDLVYALPEKEDEPESGLK